MTAHPGVFAAGVALHPSFCVTDGVGSPHHTVPGISGSLYVGVSAADEISSAKDNEPLISAVGRRGGRGVAEVHPGAGHGFAVPGASWHDDAAHRSYQAAFRLFEPLGSGTR
jgi:carboxymethylenebutenolidase